MQKMLFNDIGEFAEHLPVNASLSFDLLRTHIVGAEHRYLRPLLGDALHDALSADAIAGSSDPKHLALLERARRAAAPFAFMMYLPYAQFQISDAGFRQAQDENMRPAFRWQVERLDEACELHGWMAMEELQAFLEAKRADYPLWDYQSAHGLLINSAAEFDRHVSIDGSRLVFRRMAPHLAKAERSLTGVMGKAQLDALKLAVREGNATPEQEALLDEARPAVAHQAFALGIRTLPARFDGGMVRVYASQFPGGSDFAPKVQADAAMLAQLSAMHARLADDARAALAAFLKERHADYPLYEASGLYQAEGGAPDESGISKGGWLMA